MATKTWLGDDGGNEGNWRTAANWSASGVPANGDDLMFDGNANNDVLPSVNQPDASADEMASITVTSDFAYNIGEAGTAVILANSAGADVVRIDASSVPTYCMFDGGFPDVTILNSGTTATSCQLDGTIALLNVIKGTVTMVAGCTITTLNMLYSTTQASDANITIPATCTITNVYQRGGIATCASAIATRLDIDSGTFTLSGSATTATLNMRGGTFYWNSTGTMTKANCFGGTFDTRNNGEAKIITNMDVWPSATVYLNNGGKNITLTNAANYYGGSVVFDKGSAFQINQ